MIHQTHSNDAYNYYIPLINVKYIHPLTENIKSFVSHSYTAFEFKYWLVFQIGIPHCWLEWCGIYTADMDCTCMF